MSLHNSRMQDFSGDDFHFACQPSPSGPWLFYFPPVLWLSCLIKAWLEVFWPLLLFFLIRSFCGTHPVCSKHSKQSQCCFFACLNTSIFSITHVVLIERWQTSEFVCALQLVKQTPCAWSIPQTLYTCCSVINKGKPVTDRCTDQGCISQKHLWSQVPSNRVQRNWQLKLAMLLGNAPQAGQTVSLAD